MKYLLLIISYIFFPTLIQTARAQLGDAEKSERCENNKKRLAELQAQLEQLNIQLLNMPERKQIEDERTDMTEANRLRNLYKKERHPADAEEAEAVKVDIERLRAKYNYSCARALYSNCADGLYNFLAKKIDREEKIIPGRSALLQTRTDLEKQIAFHKNNITALGCDAYNIAIAGNWTYHDNTSDFTVGQSFDAEGKGHADVSCEYHLEASQIVMHWSNGWVNMYPLPVTNKMSGVAIGPSGERHDITLTRQ